MSRDLSHGCLVDTVDDLLDPCGVILVAVDIVRGDRRREVHLFVAFDDAVVEYGMITAEHFEEQIGDG